MPIKVRDTLYGEATGSQGTYKIQVRLAEIIGDKMYWDISSPDKRFGQFIIITDNLNKFEVNFYVKQKIPKGIVSKSVRMIIPHLEKTTVNIPLFYLRAYHPYLFAEFKKAGFERDQSKPETTMVLVQ